MPAHAVGPLFERHLSVGRCVVQVEPIHNSFCLLAGWLVAAGHIGKTFAVSEDDAAWTVAIPKTRLGLYRRSFGPIVQNTVNMFNKYFSASATVRPSLAFRGELTRGTQNNLAHDKQYNFAKSLKMFCLPSNFRCK
jgi:hypothetical protein